LNKLEINNLPIDDDGYPYQPVPKIVKVLKDQCIVSGVCGDVHTIVLNNKGDLYSFGGCTFGQLGLGSIDRMPVDLDKYPYMPIPQKIEGIPSISLISCGDSHSIAVDVNGKIWAWGSAASGQLGIDNSNLPKDMDGTPYQPIPILISFLKNQKILSVACGESHTLVLAEGDILYSFGTGACGQLGYPDVEICKTTNKSIKANESKNL
jgi:alpha-tubulin suppressor-like RCC1 family protein